MKYWLRHWMGLILFALFRGEAVALVVFSDDFEGGAKSAWSNPVTTNAGGVFSQFLGDFSNGSAALTLTGLPPHTVLNLNFDLFIIDSWDGDGQSGGGGPDLFSFSIDGNTILEESFSTFNLSHATYTSSAGATSPSNSGSNLGFSSWNDVIYRNLSNGFTVAHSDSSATILFTDLNSLQGKPDESWGIDNVVVEVVPEPSALVLCLLGIGFLLGRLRRKVA